MQRMRVIPEPDPTRRRVFAGADIPYTSGSGGAGETYQCGACSAVLVRDSLPWTIHNLAFRCTQCGACNVEATSSVLTP